MDSPTSFPRFSTALPLVRTTHCASDPAEAMETPIGVKLMYYPLCFVGGGLAGGLTASLQPPLIDQVQYKQKWSGARSMAAVHRAGGFPYTPSVATNCRKGIYKFGLYEGIKDACHAVIGDRLTIPVSLFAAFWSQSVAVVTLFDATKMVRSTASGEALTHAEFKLRNKDHIEKFYPHFGRRIRNACIQFPCYELAAEILYKQLKPKADCSKPEQLAITFTAGCIAGLICAHLTDRYDNIPASTGRFGVAKRPVPGAVTAGFASRSVAMATLVAAQWTIYEGFKIATGISNMSNRPSTKSRQQPEMPESLRKKLEESKLKKMREQNPMDLSIGLSPPLS